MFEHLFNYKMSTVILVFFISGYQDEGTATVGVHDRLFDGRGEL